MKLSLINDWHKIGPKLWSVRFIVLSLLVQAAEAFPSLPAELRDLFPSWLPTVLVVLALVSRVIQQPKLVGQEAASSETSA